MSEKLCLQWNDFKENVTSSMGSLRGDSDFADVTLACEDGKQFEAHKVILAASSPFFKNILSKNKHAHPLIYMRGLKSDDLLAMIDFLYSGETNVYQENLDSFLAIAEELQLKGLTGTASDNEVDQKDFHKQRKVSVDEIGFNNSIHTEEPAKTHIEIQRENGKHNSNAGKVALQSQFSGDLHQLNSQSTSMMVKTSTKTSSGHPLYRCMVCGKEDKSYNLRNHIEMNHLEGVSIPCSLCEKTFRCTKSLAQHKQYSHKQNFQVNA